MGGGGPLLWILLGGVFLGAVHDYVSTHIAMREGGKNLAVIARRYIGPAAFVMMLVMLIALLVLVCAAFLDLSATALTSRVAVETLQLSATQTLFRVEGGQAIIGGIASTSVIVITLFSPLIGYLYIKRQVPVWICSLLAIAICVLSIAIGLRLPVSVQPQTWKLMISVYVLLAAGLPVWLFLQSRDFINVHILYAGMAFLVGAIIAAALRGGGHFGAGTAGIPLHNWTQAGAKLGPGWPVLFVTIACGAVSGFHSLCAGGTTCKQLRTEVAARHVGYYAMLLESFLAVCVTLCLLVGLSLADYRLYCYPDSGQGNAVLTFAMAVGHTVNVGLGLPIAAGALGAMLLLEGFLVTTLDTAVRLTRYMIEEGWALFFGRYDVFAGEAARQQREAAAPVPDARGALELAGAGGLSIERPDLDAAVRGRVVETRGLGRLALKTLKYYWVNSGLAVLLMLLLGWGNGYLVVWQIFGSANQLLAALALVVGTAWLVMKGRPIWYTLLPLVFMMATSVWMLVRLLVWDYLPNWSVRAPLAITAIIVLAMTAGVVVLAVRRWVRRGLTLPYGARRCAAPPGHHPFDITENDMNRSRTSSRPWTLGLLLLVLAAGATSASAQGKDPVPPGTAWTLAAAGDALITRQVGMFGNDPAFMALVEPIRAADAAVVNLEVNLFRLWEFKGYPQAENGGNYELGPPEAATDMKWMGFDMFNMATNHTTDYGVEGMFETMRLLDALNLVYAGVGMTAGEAAQAKYYETPKGRFALIGLAASFSTMARAADPRPEVKGRPGLNALRTTSVNQLAPAQMADLRKLVQATGARVPESETAPVRFGGATFIQGPENGTLTTVNAVDEERILRAVRNAARQADHAVVYAHSHSMGSETGPAPEHMRTFIKKCLDAGADAFVISGPHTLRGFEVYNGKPIFYSLGDFFMQNETIEPVPTDMFEPEGLGIEALAADYYDARSRLDPKTGLATAYYPANQAAWESVVPVATFVGHKVTRITFYPVDIGFRVPRPHQGTPRLADPELGRKILERFAKLSEVYGTKIVIRDGVGVWDAP
ncbi:MAG: hypothetical protein FIA95_13345 [Gemmatimonadetes bacterium]|nr:hypothetical protein [Gemmatimonadota bacterium]